MNSRFGQYQSVLSCMHSAHAREFVNILPHSRRARARALAAVGALSSLWVPAPKTHNPGTQLLHAIERRPATTHYVLVVLRLNALRSSFVRSVGLEQAQLDETGGLLNLFRDETRKRRVHVMQ